ncbi:Sensor protein FixL [Seminavis robusta]|uniref:Sensor protein FixL n=1 Tax=Seminavis robusta TaxID=568900 RepID=A0A9N8HFS4_9STRA|nr:Sensor protein FixL [Seminavis robusta]|eukprot:Sro448_g145160.1 Sensor protein FixL (686) ;mRNA; r:40212-42345
MSTTGISQDFLESILDGSFDAGFLVDGLTGCVVYANKPSVDLFNAPSEDSLMKDDGAKRTIETLVSFWSYSLDQNKTDDDDSVNPSVRAVDNSTDVTPWDQVVKHASQSLAVANSGDKEPLLEWSVTGKRAAATGTRAAKAGSPDKKVQAFAPTKKESFPGAVKLTPTPGSNLWLLVIRHADHHDIIRYGSLSATGESSISRIKRSRQKSVKGSNKEPRMTIDENGIIVGINDAALAAKAESLKWVTTDLIGKHVSEAQIAQPPSSVRDSPNPRSRKMPRMLDMILESGMEPGHSACPMSGFPLRVDPNVSAMTTGGAQREENITEAAFEAALDPIFQIDEHGTIQMVNSAAVSIFGWSRHEFLGSNISMICGGGHEQNHPTYMARYLATGDTRVIGKNRELVAKRKDKSEFPILLGVVEVDTFAGDVRLFCGFVRDLTGIKAKERMAQEMVEAALDPMFQINQTGTILMVNNAALETFGYEREEFLGKNVKMICGGSHANNHDLYLKRYLRTGETRVIGKFRELPARRKDGSEFPIQLAVIEIKTGAKEERLFCGFVHNLSRAKRDQEIMRGTIDTSLDPIFHINENGIIQMVNNAACSHLGWSRDEMIGENVSLIVGGEHAAKHGLYIENYLSTGIKRAMGKKRKLTARRKDGTELPIILGLSEISISGGKERMFCAFLTLDK